MATKAQRAAAIQQRALARAERRRLAAVQAKWVPAAMTLAEFIAWEDAGGSVAKTPAIQMAEQVASSAAGSIQNSPAADYGLAPASAESTPFTDRHGSPLYLASHFAGASAFLILSGPSINELDLSLLDRRGIVTMGVNNSPAIKRCDIFTYVDRANKFLDSTWLDPGVLKIVPLQHLGKPLRQKLPNGTFCQMLKQMPDGSRPLATPRDMPAVIGCRRNANFNPDIWLTENSVNWGNSRRSAHRNKLPHILNVMLASVRTAYALGFRTLYLLGCDFRMSVERPYAFEQEKSAGGVGGNNQSYQVLNQLFGMLKPKFDAAGFKVFNCNPRSGLTTFPTTSYKSAIEAATAHVAQDPLDTAGWYDL